MPDTEIQHDAITTRRAPLRPQSINIAEKTFEAVIATDAWVQVAITGAGLAMERLLVTPDAVDLRAVAAGTVPLLDGHAIGTRSTLGRLVATRFEPGRLIGTFKFTDAPDAAPLWDRIQDGTLAHVSAGYRVERHRPAPPIDGTPAFIAERWALLEVSLVAIPADAAATVRGNSSEVAAPSMKDSTMPDTNTTAPPATADELDGIIRMARHAGFGDDLIQRTAAEALERSLSVAEFRARLIDNQPQHRAPAPRPTNFYGTQAEDPALAINRRAEALAARITGRAPSEAAREFMNATLADHARDLLAATHVRIGRYASDSEVIRTALATRAANTSSDYPGLLQSAFDRSLQVMMSADTPVRVLSRRREVADFRTLEQLTFSGPGSLAEVAEGGEVTHGPAAERREVGRLRTYARNIALTREALVNDDLGAFADPARLFAAAVAETEASAFIAMFAANGGGWGPTMSDTNPLFHSTHGNTASGTVSTTGIAAARLAMRAQTLPGGGLARVTPRHILVGPAGETAAEQALNQTAIATTEASRPVFAGSLQLHVEPRLSGAPWFLAADPAEVALLEHVVLAGSGGMPRVESFDSGPSHLGVTLRCVHDFAVVPAAWVGWVRVTGA